jgi:hypothetical protein
LVFVHGIELDDVRQVLPCVVGVLVRIGAASGLQLLKGIETLAVRAPGVSAQEFLGDVACSVQEFVTRGPSLLPPKVGAGPSVSQVAHDCAGGQAEAWLTLSEQEAGRAPPWEVYDTIGREGFVVTRADAAHGESLLASALISRRVGKFGDKESGPVSASPPAPEGREVYDDPSRRFSKVILVAGTALLVGLSVCAGVFLGRWSAPGNRIPMPVDVPVPAVSGGEAAAQTDNLLDQAAVWNEIAARKWAASAEAQDRQRQQSDYKEAFDARGKQIDCLKSVVAAQQARPSDLKWARIQLATALYRRGVMRPIPQDRTGAQADLKAAVEQYKAINEQAQKEGKADKGLQQAYAEATRELDGINTTVILDDGTPPKADVIVKPGDKSATVESGQMVEIQIKYALDQPLPDKFVVKVNGKKVESRLYEGVAAVGCKPAAGVALKLVQFKAEGDGKEKVVVDYVKGRAAEKREVELTVTK